MKAPAKVKEGSDPLTLGGEPVFWERTGGKDTPTVSNPSKRFTQDADWEATVAWYNADVVDFNRANALSNRATGIRQDTKDYQSWLHSFTYFGSDPDLVRVVKRKGSRNYVVNKITMCSLLEERTVKGIKYPRDEWGSHSATREKYLENGRLSRNERTTNTRDVGKLQLVHNSKYPLNWESSMSKQRPLEGYDGRSRPPTVVQLLAESYTTDPAVSRYISKSSKILTYYGRGVKRSPVGRPLSVLAQAEKRILAVIKARAYLRKKHYRGIHYRGTKPLESIYGALMSHPYETARYNSWMNAPEAMRLGNITSRYNYVIPTPAQVKIFNEDNFYSDYANWWTNDATDETRLTCWLAQRHVHNFKSILKAPHIPADMSYLDRRLIFLDYQHACGRISEETYLAARGRLLISNERANKAFILIGKPYGETRPKRKLRARLGLPKPSDASQGHLHYDIEIGELYPLPYSVETQALSPLPLTVGVDPYEAIFANKVSLYAMPAMNDEEYDNITRTEPNSVDDHLLSSGLIGLREYSLVGSLLAQSVFRILSDGSPVVKKLDVLAMGEEHCSLKELGFKRIYLSIAIERVSLMGLNSPDTSSLNTGAPESHTVDVDEKQPVKVNASLERAKVVFNKVLDYITT